MAKPPIASNDDRNSNKLTPTYSKKIEINNELVIKQTAFESVQCTTDEYIKSSTEIERRKLAFQQRKAQEEK
ncbi:hypothetical protein [Aeromonas jandaei]|uniref:hypothetical protein n=1 Tax=Aeromonas jandaei TaxID=650 RepID=UPI001057072E|nr:hypothetical protein [Aeromonas jandaei]